MSLTYAKSVVRALDVGTVVPATQSESIVPKVFNALVYAH